GAGSPRERGRGAARGHAPPRMPRSPHRGERAAPPDDPVRLRSVRQRRPTPPKPEHGEPGADLALASWPDPRSSRTRRVAPRLRARRVGSAEVLPPEKPGRVSRGDVSVIERSDFRGATAGRSWRGRGGWAW